VSVVKDEPQRRLRAPARRALIESAARAAFAADGYQATSMGAIAVAAGVSRPVLYDHFPSKRDLFLALLRDDHAELMQHLAASVAGAGEPPRERARHTIEAFFAFIDTHPLAARALSDEPFGDDEILRVCRRLHRRTKEAMLGWFGLPADDRGRATVELVYSALAGVAGQRHRRPRLNREAVVDAAMDVLWSGLGARYTRARATSA
jgi:AcrR family transcriptional regulator